jgi:ABC-type Fe3+ transport system permease subunit
MLGREPRLPHVVLRGLILALLLLNGLQLVLLQGAINSSEMREVGTTWLYAGISAGLTLCAGLLILYAFRRGRQGKP